MKYHTGGKILVLYMDTYKQEEGQNESNRDDR
jgi:hypothetical protein